MMRFSSKRTQAFKLFWPIIVILTAFFMLLMAFEPTPRKWIILVNLSVASLSFSGVLWWSADFAAERVGKNMILGAIYGGGLLMAWAVAFSISNFLFLDSCSIKQCLFVPVMWICFFGWPIAMLCGVLYSTRCRVPRTNRNH